MKCVCVEGVEERPIYSSRGWFPTNAHMEGDQVPWHLLLKVHLEGNQARFGRPRGSADPTWQPLGLIFCWMVYSLSLSLSSGASCVEAPFPLTCGPSL